MRNSIRANASLLFMVWVYVSLLRALLFLFRLLFQTGLTFIWFIGVCFVFVGGLLALRGEMRARHDA